METRTYNVYSFKEASEELKEKILDNYRYINVDDSFWYTQDEIYNEITKDYGIVIDMNNVTFDLDRDSFVAFDTYNHGQEKNWTIPIYIKNVKKFCKKAKVRYKKDIDISIQHEHFVGSYIQNYVETDYIEAEEKFNDCLQAMLEEILKELKRQYNYLTDDEAVIETLICNEYMFNEQGKID